MMVSGTFNLDVCIKIFLRMVRCYRESFHILEHSTDNVKLLKSVNSTQIAKDVKSVENYEECGLQSWMRTIRIPASLVQQFFESDVGNTIIGTLVEFTVDNDSESNGIENGKLIC